MRQRAPQQERPVRSGNKRIAGRYPVRHGWRTGYLGSGRFGIEGGSSCMTNPPQETVEGYAGKGQGRAEVDDGIGRGDGSAGHTKTGRLSCSLPQSCS